MKTFDFLIQIWLLGAHVSAWVVHNPRRRATPTKATKRGVGERSQNGPMPRRVVLGPSLAAALVTLSPKTARAKDGGPVVATDRRGAEVDSTQWLVEHGKRPDLVLGLPLIRSKLNDTIFLMAYQFALC